MLKKDGCVLRYSFKSAGAALRFLVHGSQADQHKLGSCATKNTSHFKRSSGNYVTLEKSFMNIVFISKGNDPF